RRCASVPEAQTVPTIRSGLYPARRMAGTLISASVATVAATMPVAAARRAPTTSTELAGPPLTLPKSRAPVSSSCSAHFDRSRRTPMNTNKGSAISSSLVIMPYMRLASPPIVRHWKTSSTTPRPANASAVPARVNATGKPMRMPAIRKPNIRMQRTSANSMSGTRFEGATATQHFYRLHQERQPLQHQEQAEGVDQALVHVHEGQAADIRRSLEQPPRPHDRAVARPQDDPDQ